MKAERQNQQADCGHRRHTAKTRSHCDQPFGMNDVTGQNREAQQDYCGRHYSRESRRRENV